MVAPADMPWQEARIALTALRKNRLPGAPRSQAEADHEWSLVLASEPLVDPVLFPPIPDEAHEDDPLLRAPTGIESPWARRDRSAA